MSFLLFLPILISLLTISGQLNLYNTDRTMNTGQLQFDCLHYYMQNDTSHDQWLSNHTFLTIPYCIRPVHRDIISFDDLTNRRNNKFTFEELHVADITAHQLLSWSASIDLAENYQLYVDQISVEHSLSHELFFNCTQPWFGSRCQYSFGFSERMSLADFIQVISSTKQNYTESPHTITNLSCYVHLRCERGGPPLCLDWREICNGRIDCVNGGVDEALCLDLEINECDENEYRCYNGLCISQDFWRDNRYAPDCLDQSDELTDIKQSCYKDPSFQCEESSCGPNHPAFACGDGQCVLDFDQCRNGRNILLLQSMFIQDELSSECKKEMMCLTRISDEINGRSCRSWFQNKSVSALLDTCDPLFQFPSVPVIHSYVHFLYFRNRSKFNINYVLAPDFICYDAQLCDFLVPTFLYKNATCRRSDEIEYSSMLSIDSWRAMISKYKLFFNRCSSTLLTMVGTMNSYTNHSSLYCCKNSSKCISKHRLLDDIYDCYKDDDETNPELSCSLGDKYRFKCPNNGNCYSSIVSLTQCYSLNVNNQEEIPFQLFCDDVRSVSYMAGGNWATDETDCDRWPCDNIYTRCDGYETCVHGEDEDKCLQSLDSEIIRTCVSPSNYTIIYLPFHRLRDGVIDCLGAFDELKQCRRKYRTQTSSRFGCLGKQTLCVSSSYLCDGLRHCPQGDDENFCGSHRRICDESHTRNRTEVENILCKFTDIDKRKEKIYYFALDNWNILSSSSENKLVQSTERIQQPVFVTNSSNSQRISPVWAWRCNRGLSTHVWRENITYEECFCPPSYYGNLCQYQNERVSLTLGVVAADLSITYEIVVMLIEDDNYFLTINSHDQFTFQPNRGCSIKFNTYLLYPTRPKNISKNYSVRIDAFNKKTLAYYASWHLSIPFLFLPVNRLTARLVVPPRPVETSRDCSVTCYNGGRCVKYRNKNQSVCRCISKWFGSQCNIPSNCHLCSEDSICIGSIGNRSICVCPLAKYGPRCLLRLVCPSNACKNNGLCMPAGGSLSARNYTCVCTEAFFGSKCEYEKTKLEISFGDIEIPSYMIMYFITTSRRSKPSCTIIVQKISMGQHTVTQRISRLFHIVFVKFNNNYYLAVLQRNQNPQISTSIRSGDQCIHIKQLFNSSMMGMIDFQRIKYYHDLCQSPHHLQCFSDEIRMCLCTNEHHANCFEFEHNISFPCHISDLCENGGQCLQANRDCISARVCICNGCYFGDRCQFYAKGFGLTLDDILRYEIRQNVAFSQQSLLVKVSIAVITLIFGSGFISSVLSGLTFYTKNSCETGCGNYLFASSITSLLTMFTVVLNFSILIAFQMGLFTSRSLFWFDCIFIEPLLKVFIHVGGWLHGFVAIERIFIVSKGITFNKATTKKIAKWIIFIAPVLIFTTTVHEPIYRSLFDDYEDQRTWCVAYYSPSMRKYHSFILLFHFFSPFIINHISAIVIIFASARRRFESHVQQTYQRHLWKQLIQHKQLLISPLFLIILALPSLIISFVSDCLKTFRDTWLYLSAYFISFLPAAFTFAIFVLPSELYKKEFKKTMKHFKCKQ